ncbi:hypothetical protein RFI_14845 [Reticulomyxa filosa]|uniref:Uncharacterized protein n=1 Tax=Reticulomyxa filosa TaxID=46433 RepID=X6NAM3_RETFI|nr:hypothetical protein RFI_14845 [Reticulomyxa filosa]|eukprot:ETO22352.1 hypothetical protein RFI_14845 [Reticulomyxa filosa]
MPFVIGIKAHVVNHLDKYPMNEVVLIDLDKNAVVSSYTELHRLPHETTWKLKRALKTLLKKSKELMSNSDNTELVANVSSSNFKVKKLKIFDNLHGMFTFVTFFIFLFLMLQSLQQYCHYANMHIPGWDDSAFFDAFLAFFVVFVGDWQNYFHAHSPTVPIPPFHLASEDVQLRVLDDILRSGHPVGKTLAKKVRPFEIALAQGSGINKQELATETTTTTTTTTMATTEPIDERPSHENGVDDNLDTIASHPRLSYSRSESTSRSEDQTSSIVIGENEEATESKKIQRREAIVNGPSSSSMLSHTAMTTTMMTAVTSTSTSTSTSSLGGKYMAELKNWKHKWQRVAGKRNVSIGGGGSFKLISATERLVRRTTRKQNKKALHITYDEEVLIYFQRMCQSQFFQSWFVRQKEDALHPHTKLQGMQVHLFKLFFFFLRIRTIINSPFFKKKKKDRFDYAMRNRSLYGGASYSGCFRFLREATMSHDNVANLTINLKSYVEDMAALTSAKEMIEFVERKEMHAEQLASGARHPRVFDALNNVLHYRLKNCIGKSYQHGLMGLFLLTYFVQNSTDRYVVAATNLFFPVILQLTQYRHPHDDIQLKMCKQASKLHQMVTNIDQLKKTRQKKYVTLKDLRSFEFKEEDHLEGTKKSNWIDEATVAANFVTTNLDKKEQDMMTDLLGLSSNDFDDEGTKYNTDKLQKKCGKEEKKKRKKDNNNNNTETYKKISQFDAKDPKAYRDKMVAGEVKMIPPFDHLHRQFQPQLRPSHLSNFRSSYDSAYSDKKKKKASNQIQYPSNKDIAPFNSKDKPLNLQTQTTVKSENDIFFLDDITIFEDKKQTSSASNPSLSSSMPMFRDSHNDPDFIDFDKSFSEKVPVPKLLIGAKQINTQNQQASINNNLTNDKKKDFDFDFFQTSNNTNHTASNQDSVKHQSSTTTPYKPITRTNTGNNNIISSFSTPLTISANNNPSKTLEDAKKQPQDNFNNVDLFDFFNTAPKQTYNNSNYGHNVNNDPPNKNKKVNVQELIKSGAYTNQNNSNNTHCDLFQGL